MWRPGQKLIHPFNPDLGTGVVRSVEGRFLEVWFPEADTQLRMAIEGSGLEPLTFAAGEPALLEGGEPVVVAAPAAQGYRLEDGRTVAEADLWPAARRGTPGERLARLDLDPIAAFRNRCEGTRLETLRRGKGLGPLLGGRIQLFAHQLHTAERALQGDPVRWLLADEVGLGKTIEACLILQALLRAGRARRALVVAPRMLVVQWLGELYRKFHQVFALLDPQRIDASTLVYEEDTNPFEVHEAGVIALETLTSDRRIAALAEAAAPDLIVVDEAHRLVRDDLDRTVGPLVRGARHALLLTAAPLAADRLGFYRLLELLHPEAFASFADFEEAVETGRASLPCTSAVRRIDLGGFPPRLASAIDIDLPGTRFALDPRATWLAQSAPEWRARGEKALVFVRSAETAEGLKRFLENRTRQHVAAFHEEMSTALRDIELARFRDSRAPLLVASEAGGEGRNFQFCDRIVHYELPLDPVLLEQRIGRLDRIGRHTPVEQIYFRVRGASPDVARLYEKMELFTRPSAGLDAALTGVASQLREATRRGIPLDPENVARGVEAERRRHRRDLPRTFYPDAYTRSRGPEILARIPAELEPRTRGFCVGAARLLGLEAIDKGGRGTWYFELGAGTTVDALPGIPGGSRFLGSFDREEAVLREEIDFLASGHPLIEGLLLELRDGLRGRVAVAELPGTALRGLAWLWIDAAGGVHALDREGAVRPEWIEPILRALPGARDADPLRWGPDRAAWGELVRRTLQAGRGALGGEPVALALLRLSEPRAGEDARQPVRRRPPAGCRTG
ncbi:MAG: helicase-related protein [Myxococcota bacterium]